jgi:DHA1 family tetracycline resistance protein-like MFS transporter
VSTAGLAIDWVVMALAPSLWWLVAGRLVGGVTSATGSAIFAYMADVTPADQRARAFGLVGAAAAAGFVAGPALGGVLGAAGPRVPFWVAAALSACAWVYGFVVLRESLPAERRTPFSWGRANAWGALRLLASGRELGGLATGFFLLTFTHRLFMTVYVLYAAHRHGLSTPVIGGLLALSSVGDIVMQGVFVGPLSKRFGERAVMTVGQLGGAVSLVLMGLAPTPLLFALALLPNTLWGLAEPTIKALMSARVPESEQGRLQGASQSVMSLAGILGPTAFGWIYAASAASAPWLVFATGGGLLFLAALVTLATRGHSVAFQE